MKKIKIYSLLKIKFLISLVIYCGFATAEESYPGKEYTEFTCRNVYDHEVTHKVLVYEKDHSILEFTTPLSLFLSHDFSQENYNLGLSVGLSLTYAKAEFRGRINGCSVDYKVERMPTVIVDKEYSNRSEQMFMTLKFDFGQSMRKNKNNNVENVNYFGARVGSTLFHPGIYISDSHFIYIKPIGIFMEYADFMNLNSGYIGELEYVSRADTMSNGFIKDLSITLGYKHGVLDIESNQIISSVGFTW